MTRKQILKLKPEFKFGNITMIDWFEITEGHDYFIIRSGLRHADGETKSPYYYEDFVGGKNSSKIALERFTKWWETKQYPKYLVRPDDYSIFDLDESNNCYRSWSKKPITYSDGTRPKAYDHFTFENLTKNYDFFPIDESELDIYEEKCHEHYKFLGWLSRPDGHGGCKGGTYEEFLKSKR